MAEDHCLISSQWTWKAFNPTSYYFFNSFLIFFPFIPLSFVLVCYHGARFVAASHRMIKCGNDVNSLLLGECRFEWNSRPIADTSNNNTGVVVCKVSNFSFFTHFPPNQQWGRRDSLRSRQTSQWCGARGWSCPVLSSTTLALFSGPKMVWLWASERTFGVRHHTRSLDLAFLTQRQFLFSNYFWFLLTELAEAASSQEFSFKLTSHTRGLNIFLLPRFCWKWRLLNLPPCCKVHGNT